ncbi:hypothetical protein OK024_07665 [Acinetobacter sp. UGAL515B_02]|nr:hypothetical protein [Acinetobacter sp. UGAL515B_02]WON81458.1 hypothetical protein OK024_07665 [Acinetobacter sp. UGAL515B_02]
MFLFLLITFWIFYQYSWSAAAAKDALSTTGSYFGAVATLGATVVAAYLFNDWRVQKAFDLKLELINEILMLIEYLDPNLNVMLNESIHDLTNTSKKFFKIYEILKSNRIGMSYNGKLDKYHQDASKIILNLMVYGERVLTATEQHKIMLYRGYITVELRDKIEDKKFEILNET